MWGVISAVFLVLYCGMSCYIGRRGWNTLGKSASRVKQIIYWSFFALLILSFPASEILEGYLPEAGGLWLTIWGSYSMVAVSYIFLLVILIDFFRMIDKRAGFIPVSIKEHKKTPLILSILVVITVTAALAYGSYNALNHRVTEYELTVDKYAGPLKQLRITMVSDTHYGAIVNAERLSDMVKTINELKPDIILLAGDIIEGTIRQEEARELADVLSRMQAPFGKFAVPGNHDRGLRDNNGVLSRYFKEAGINVLRDNCIKAGDGFYIIGRDDPGRRNGQGRKEINELVKEADSSMLLILLDHQPIDIDKAVECGIDLQFSGHTHCGQIFPANLVTGRIYEMDWGLLKRGKYQLIVSSGFGTWGPPLRLGNHPEVISVTIKFNKDI